MSGNTPRQRSIQVNGIELCYFEWGQPGPEGSLLLTHATGFHGRCWDQVIAALPDDWRNRHIIAWDQRGHGRSAKVPPYNWASCGADLTAFVAALDLQVACAAGHSMGGHLLVLAAADLPDRFARLVLIDPVIMAPDLPRPAKPLRRPRITR
jgi:lipase